MKTNWISAIDVSLHKYLEMDQFYRTNYVKKKQFNDSLNIVGPQLITLFNQKENIMMLIKFIYINSQMNNEESV